MRFLYSKTKQNKDVSRINSRQGSRNKILLVFFGFGMSLLSELAIAAGGITHVPMSWCVVEGSPVEVDPNIPHKRPSGIFEMDKITDRIIWRRHERPTDNIFKIGSNQVLTLRSGINNIWPGPFSFPKIPDPDLSTVCGNFECVTKSDVFINPASPFAPPELVSLINNCRQAYTNLGKSGVGITAINLGLFHNNDPEPIGILGVGGCLRLTQTSPCKTPVKGFIAVVDNSYTYPYSPDRTFPPNNDRTGGTFFLTDPYDQLVAHEVGHALDLPHRPGDPTALMFPTQRDNVPPFGRVDNIGLNATEIATLKANAKSVPGAINDPPGIFNPGRFQADIRMDEEVEQNLVNYMNVASMQATWDTKTAESTLEASLNGLLPSESTEILDFWFAINVDNDSDSGAPKSEIQALGFPTDATATGIETLALVSIQNDKIVEFQAWKSEDNRLIPTDLIQPEILKLYVDTLVGPIVGPGEQPILELNLSEKRIPVRSVVRITGTGVENVIIPSEKPLTAEDAQAPVAQFNAPFKAQLVTAMGEEVLDKISNNGPVGFMIENASFPNCFPQQDPVTAGSTVSVDFEDFPSQLEGKQVHAMLGADQIADAVIEAGGLGTVDMPIPLGAEPGSRLITIGAEGTALTADCNIEVIAPPPVASCDPNTPGAIIGTDGNNFLSGTPGDDVIIGLGGNDTIFGRGGNDCIDGGDGKDLILTREGDDQIIGGSGDDRVFSGGGADTITGGDGNDNIFSGAGDDQISGGPDDDQITGNGGDDVIDGGPGDDKLNGSGGTDDIDGGSGTDSCNGESVSQCE